MKICVKAILIKKITKIKYISEYFFKFSNRIFWTATCFYNQRKFFAIETFTENAIFYLYALIAYSMYYFQFSVL